MKKNIRRYLKLLLALFIAAFSFNLFLLPTKIVAGGVNGIAIILEQNLNIDPALIIFIVSFCCFILGLILIGKETFYAALISTIIYPLFVKLTLPLTKMIIISTSDLFLITIVVGVISGITNGIIYRNGFNNGSIGIINQIIHKYLKISISKSSFIINSIIILLGSFYFGWTKVMYAIVMIFINSIVMNKVILGISSKKAFYIVSKKSFEIERFIIDELNHSVTIFNSKGGFLFNNKKMILAIIPTREYFSLTEGIKEIDENAFFIATNAYESYGEE